LHLTLIGIPLGILAWLIGGAPLAYTQKKHLERRRAWLNRDRPMPNDATPPWLLEDELSQGPELSEPDV
jgi:hypothetical protein